MDPALKVVLEQLKELTEDIKGIKERNILPIIYDGSFANSNVIRKKF
jgi:hypothetical protein